MIAPFPLSSHVDAIKKQAVSTNSEQPESRQSWVEKLQRLWYSLQVSQYGGKYSIERLLALEEYTKTTSLARVLLVCIGTPLPMIIVVMLQECVPLQDPAAGWQANHGFWIRAAVLGGVVAVGMAAFVIFMIPGIVISALQLALLFVSVAFCYPFIGMAVAELWAFPIPFMVQTIISLYVLLVAALFRIIAGKRVISQIMAHKDEAILLVSFSSSQSIMSVTYAAYQVLFDAATDTHYEIPVILLLPLIKLIMKNLVSRFILHMNDMIPEAVIFTVDFFNAMYLATCMQNTSSITTIATMMAIDFIHTVIALRGLHRRTETILSRLHQACGEVSGSSDLLSAVGMLCRDMKKFEQQNRTDVLLQSCLPHRLSPEVRRLLEQLKRAPGNGARIIPRLFSRPSLARIDGSFRATLSRGGSFQSSITKSRARGLPKLRSSLWHNSDSKITPTPIVPSDSTKTARDQSSNAINSTTDQHRTVLSETLEVLFTSECIILAEYLESIIPVLYGHFILLVVFLPSAKYHLDLVGITRGNVGDTLGGVFLYALLEFVSFVTLAVMMIRIVECMRFIT